MPDFLTIRQNAQPLDFEGDYIEIGDRAEFVAKMFRILDKWSTFSIGINESFSDLNALIKALRVQLSVEEGELDTAQKRADAIALVADSVAALGVGNISGLRAELDLLALNGGSTPSGRINALRLPPGGVLGSGRHHTLDVREFTDSITWTSYVLPVQTFIVPDGENDSELISFTTEGPNFARLRGWFLTLDGSVSDEVVIGQRGKHIHGYWVGSESAWALSDARDRPIALPDAAVRKAMTATITNEPGVSGTMTATIENEPA